MDHMVKPVVWAFVIAAAATLELAWSAAPWTDDRAMRNVSLETGLEAYRADVVQTQEQEWQALGAMLTNAQWSPDAPKSRDEQKM
ncbi:hypothetical protein ACFL12_00415 [Pseudomonadota bacterium]